MFWINAKTSSHGSSRLEKRRPRLQGYKLDDNIYIDQRHFQALVESQRASEGFVHAESDTSCMQIPIHHAPGPRQALSPPSPLDSNMPNNVAPRGLVVQSRSNEGPPNTALIESVDQCRNYHLFPGRPRLTWRRTSWRRLRSPQSLDCVLVFIGALVSVKAFVV